MKHCSILTVVTGLICLLLAGCSTAAKERRAEKRELKEWKDDGKSRWERWQDWERKKSDEMWERFKERNS